MKNGQSILGLILLLISAGCANKITPAKSEPSKQKTTHSTTHGPAEQIAEMPVNNPAPKEVTVQTESKVEISNPVTYTPSGKYATANFLYSKMIDSLSKVISEYPINDSSGLTYASDWVGTPNMGLRRANYIIIHHTATNNCNETLHEFTTPGGREASAHYVICEDGTVYHMLNDMLRSHHAGESKWGNTTDLNSSS
ncbi:MAG: N-acetylmuramoyl-L-alanine amidase, partial [Chitinophagaceae bacterium]